MKGPKFSGGQYQKTWELQKPSILKTFYEGIIRELKDSSQFGLGKAARMILGEDGAQQLRAREGLLLPSL